MLPLSLAFDDQGCGSNLAFRPSEYTAALIQVLRARAVHIRGANVLEIGCGSGVVLAALGALGADSLCGIDIESEAIVSSSRLLRELGYGNAQLCRGDMWSAVADRRFDLIAANLPHFPMEPGRYAGRLPSWSCGGPDGRALLDRFLKGLDAHLERGGRAVITHNALVGLDLSRSMVERSGLSLRVAMTMPIYIPGDKLELMTKRVLNVEEGRSIYRCGPYAFTEMHVVEIGLAETLG